MDVVVFESSEILLSTEVSVNVLSLSMADMIPGKNASSIYALDATSICLRTEVIFIGCKYHGAADPISIDKKKIINVAAPHLRRPMVTEDRHLLAASSASRKRIRRD